MRLSDHLHQLTFPFTVMTPQGPAPRFVNAFLVDDAEGVTLIDAGVRGSSQAILSYLGERRSRPPSGVLLERRRGSKRWMPPCAACGLSAAQSPPSSSLGRSSRG